MMNIGTPNLVIEEKMDIKIYKKTYAFLDYLNKPKLKEFNYFFGMNIKRFAAEDVYSIYVNYDGNTRTNINNHFLLSNDIVNIINNKIKLNKIFIRGERDYSISQGTLLFHHSEIKEKFSDTKYLFSYLNYNPALINEYFLFSDRQRMSLKAMSYALFFNFDKITKNHKIKTNDLVKFSFIKNMKFGESNRTKIINNVLKSKRRNTHEITDSKRIYATINNSDFFIKFNELNQLKNNQDLAAIYWRPNNKNDVFDSDFQFNDKSYIKVGTHKYKIIFQKFPNFKKDMKKMKTGEIIQVGKLLLLEYISYNFEKKKIINEGSEFSSRGLLIPFDFKGDFFYKMHLGINKIFDNIDFYVHQTIAQKTLDPYEGKIRIEIETDNFDFLNEINKEIYEIKSDDFKELINLGELINPLAIIRISSNEKQKTS